MSRIYSIAPGRPFAAALAAGLLAEAGEDLLGLGRVTVLLPSHRACRMLRETFLRLTDGRATILPRIRPLGEADEDELAILGGPAAAAALDLPPEIPDLHRKLLLTRLILRRAAGPEGRPPSPDQAARLAVALGQFLDQMQADGLDPAGLAGLVPEAFARHWQVTLDFLALVTEHWPAILAECGAMDRVARRQALIAAQIAAWQAAPPTDPVIAAGSVAPDPSQRALLAAVAALPRGRVVLPGLEPEPHPADWQAVIADPAHPQHLLARLLEVLNVAPTAVADWPYRAPGDADDPPRQARRTLIREALRPAPTTHRWRHLQGIEPAALAGVERVDCTGPREEAMVIALMLRDVLEWQDGTATAALVTPDRALARRVAAALARWGIDIDDSAGVPLSGTPPAIFIRLVADMAAEAWAPVPLLALLKHPLCACGMATGRFRRQVRRLERILLRGPRPGPGAAGLRAALAAVPEDRLAPQQRRELMAVIDTVAAALDGLDAALADPAADAGALLRGHLAAAEALAADDRMSGAERLWRGEAGEALADFVHGLARALPGFEPMAARRYPALLEALMADRVVRPRYGRHPRLFIWGTLEAQLQQPDLVILAGLNEGVWPPDPGADPWMSRPMRRDFGLPLPELRIGRSAHDFQQLVCAPRVVMTRAARVEGAPTVASRWLLRLDNVLDKLGIADALSGESPWAAWAEQLDTGAPGPKIGRPAPCPPLTARPARLSVTQIETWMRDPYGIYARHVLGLKKLDPLDADPGAGDYGTLIHGALDLFMCRYPDRVPEDGLARLIEIGREMFEPVLALPGVWAFWWPRFTRIAAWFVAVERAGRAQRRSSLTEAEGRLTLGGFQLQGRADRLDIHPEGGVTIIDYKTGQPPSWAALRQGLAPQLPLEAAMVRRGAIDGMTARTPVGLAFWRLSGGDPAGEIKTFDAKRHKVSVAELAEEAHQGLRRLIAAFADPTTPYYAVPRAEWAPVHNDYAHLERLAEWRDAEDGDGA